MRRRLSVEEMEYQANISRNEERRPTLNDREKLERKLLGPLWGKRRRKLEGWPPSAP